MSRGGPPETTFDSPMRQRYVVDVVTTHHRCADKASFGSSVNHTLTLPDPTRRRQGMSVGAGDFDRDGYVDLFTTEWNGQPPVTCGGTHARFLHNRGSEAAGFFEDGTEATRTIMTFGNIGTTQLPLSFSPAFPDLDAFLTNHHSTPVLYRNDGGNAGDWIRVRTAGVVSPASGRGAKVTVVAE